MTLCYISLLPENIPFMEAMRMKMFIRSLISISAEIVSAFTISLFAGVVTGGSGRGLEAKA